MLPGFLILVNRSWLYSQAGWLDPWIYSGYHMHFAALWRDFPSAYYGTRMPWTAFGFLVHRLFPVEPALYILALSLFYTSTFSLFYTVRLLFKSPLAGFIAACLLGTNSWFLWSIGWNYIDGPMITLIFLGIAALCGAAMGEKWRTASALWGAVTAATIALFSANIDLLPLYAGTFIALNCLNSRRRIATVALYWSGGFCVSVLSMCLTNWLLGGDFLFFLPQFTTAVSLYGSERSKMPAWNSWAWSATWLYFPAFGFLASIALLSLRGPRFFREVRNRELSGALLNEAHLLTLALLCFLATAGFLIMDALRLGMLTYVYHANELWPFTFLVFGGCFAIALSRMPRSSAPSLALATPLLCLCPWIAGALGWLRVPLPNEPQLFTGSVVEPAWMFAGAGLLITILFVRSWLPSVVLIAFAATLNLVTMVGFGPIRLPDPGYGRDLALSVFDLAAIIDKTESDRPMPFWWDRKDPYGIVFSSLSEMMYLRYPTLDPPPAITPGDRVVFLTSKNNVLQLERSLIRDGDFTATPVVQDRVREGPVDLRIAIEDVHFATARLSEVSVPLLVNPPPTGGVSVAHIVTQPTAWSYAAQVMVPPGIRRAHPGPSFVRVRLKVTAGIIGVGVTLDDGSTFIERKFFTPSEQTRDVYLSIPALKAAKQIVICNGGTTKESAADLYSASIFYKRT